MTSFMTKRCAWVEGQEQIYLDYHDNEWGVPVRDDAKLFEFLILEGAQAGLSWLTILKRREGYRKAFDDFDVKKVAKYNDKKITRLMQNKEIIRNKLKIKSTVKNAQAFIEIQKEFGSFSNYLWAYVDNQSIKNKFKSVDKIPTQTKLSTIISNNLKKRGMSFVGSTIIYAYLQAVGIVNDHEIGCFCYKK